MVRGLIADMFGAPRAPADAHTWAAALLAHAALGAVLVAAVARLPPQRRRPVLAVALAFWSIWDGGQRPLAGGGLADGAMVWAAVTLDAIAGHAVWDSQGRRVAATVAALAAVMWAGAPAAQAPT